MQIAVYIDIEPFHRRIDMISSKANDVAKKNFY